MPGHLKKKTFETTKEIFYVTLLGNLIILFAIFEIS